MATSANPTQLLSPDRQLNPILTDVYDINDKGAVEKVNKHLEDRWRVANHRRWQFELKWLRNILWAAGIQWTRVDWAAQRVTNLTLPVGFPRAITNKYFQVMDDRLNAIIQGRIPLNHVPATDDPEDLATAQVCERAREVIDIESRTEQLKRDLGFWRTYAGTAALELYYDYSPENGVIQVPVQQCVNCGLQGKVGELGGATGQEPCPQCTVTALKLGMPPQPTAYQPAMDPNGQPLTEGMPVGRLCADVLSPFEIYKDNTVRLGSGHTRWYFRPRKYSVETARALQKQNGWPEDIKITEGMNDAYRPSRNYLLAIAYAGSYLTGTTAVGDTTARDEFRKQLTIWEYKEEPTPDYPKGLRVVKIADRIAELGPLPNVWGAGQLKGVPFLPYVETYEDITGGAWGKPKADDVIPLQARRNIIESNLQLTAQRTGSPKLLTPYGAGVKNIVGEAGQILEFKPLSFGGTSVVEPRYLEAALGNVQPLVMLIKLLDDGMERIAGTYFLQGGDAPAGVTAASALAYLGERSNRAIAPTKEQWAETWRQFYQMAIEIARQHWTDERVLAILGKNKEWQFEKFKGADLTGAVDVRIDYEALFPKSQATERANIMQLVQMGAIQPATDRQQAYGVLESFGETKLMPDMDDALAQAIREWDAFLNKDVEPVLLPLAQNSPIHLAQHKRDCATQEFEILYRTNQQKADVWLAHIQGTAMDVAAASMPMLPGSVLGGPAGSTEPGSQGGSQAGSASGNLAPGGAPAAKGEEAAQAETMPPGVR